MHSICQFRLATLVGAAMAVLAAASAAAQDFQAPFFGASYLPGPNYIGPVGGAIGFDQSFYQGVSQYPAAGYGGGPYRRAAYSAADVYVNAGYPCADVVPVVSYRPVVRTHFAPVVTYRAYRTVHYQPVAHFRAVRRPCCY
jgi:hypothetical protein